MNATRQTGSVLGVALFGALIGRSGAFMAGAHASLMIAGLGLFTAAGTMGWAGRGTRGQRAP